MSTQGIEVLLNSLHIYAFQEETRRKFSSNPVCCLWINMWIIERSICLKICPCCWCQVAYVQSSPKRILTSCIQRRRIKMKCTDTAVVPSHKDMDSRGIWAPWISVAVTLCGQTAFFWNFWLGLAVMMKITPHTPTRTHTVLINFPI